MVVGADYCRVACEIPPYRLSGTVYAALFNHRSALQALGAAASQPPYNAPPQAPVLTIKPRNTLVPSGSVVQIPLGTTELEVGACVGLVIGKTACNVAQSRALDYVTGYLIVADVSIPHSNYHRPSVRYKARDGFCPLGPSVVACAVVANPDALTSRTYVDDVLVQTASSADSVRAAARLLADVTDFMTLAPGDVLALGAAAPAPRVRAGQRAAIEIEGLGRLQMAFADESP